MITQQDRANIFKYATFDSSALCRLANELRRQPCFCDPSQVPKSRSLNWTICVKFAEPREDGAIRSQKANLSLLASEAATLKYIRAHMISGPAQKTCLAIVFDEPLQALI
jgi:hypothetical protein